MKRSHPFGLIPIYLGLLIVFSASAKAEWTPTQPITIVVPAGEAGGAAELAKIIQNIVEKNKLSQQPLKIVYMPKDSGAEGFLHVKENAGNAHMLVITLSSIFTTPRNTGANFSYADFTPITLLARDYFILWVRSGTYKSLDELFAVARQKPGGLKVGGTGSKQEDQLVMTAVEGEANVRFSYKPYAGGGAVAKALASGEVDVTFNNPSEAVKLWEEGKVVPLGLASYQRLTDPKWKDIPTLKEKGYSVDYKMIRAIFAPPKIPNTVQVFYTRLFDNVTKTPDWKAYTKNNALQDWFLTKQLLTSLIQYEDLLHGELIKEMNERMGVAAKTSLKSQPADKGNLVREK
jgi:putative tricarboxylic transport membrane protein